MLKKVQLPVFESKLEEVQFTIFDHTVSSFLIPKCGVANVVKNYFAIYKKKRSFN
jgi:hypothetical protein